MEQISLALLEKSSNYLNLSRTTEDTQDKISRYLTNQHITWKFIPQCSPHFGGLWEAAVKSIKYRLQKTVGDLKLLHTKSYLQYLHKLKPAWTADPLLMITRALKYWTLGY